jgi:predicted PurR-regulated permease PerM
MSIQIGTVSPWIRGLLVSACLVVIIAGMRAASPVLSPLLLAIFLAVLLYPAYRWLLNLGVPTWLTVSIMVLGVSLVGSGLLTLLWLSLAQLRDNLFLYAARLVDLRQRAETLLADFGLDVPTILTQDVFERQFVLTWAARIVTNLGSLVATGFFVVVATIFLLLQTTHLAERLQRDYGPNSLLHSRAAQVGQGVARFFAIRVRVNLIVAAGVTLWLLILGVDLAILWGIVAFFLSFIMYVGLTVAALPPMLLAMAESGPWYAVLVIIGVVVINVAIENVVAPAMMGQGLNLAPVVALASLVFWAWVLGPLGLIIAIPLTVIIVMLLASDPETYWLLVLMTMDAAPAVKLVHPDDPTPRRGPAPAEEVI